MISNVVGPLPYSAICTSQCPLYSTVRQCRIISLYINVCIYQATESRSMYLLIYVFDGYDDCALGGKSSLTIVGQLVVSHDRGVWRGIRKSWHGL